MIYIKFSLLKIASLTLDDDNFLDFLRSASKKVEHCDMNAQLFAIVIRLLFFDFMINTCNYLCKFMVIIIPANKVDDDENYSKFYKVNQV